MNDSKPFSVYKRPNTLTLSIMQYPKNIYSSIITLKNVFNLSSAIVISLLMFLCDCFKIKCHNTLRVAERSMESSVALAICNEYLAHTPR